MAALHQIAAIVVFTSALVAAVAVIGRSLANSRVWTVLRDRGGW